MSKIKKIIKFFLTLPKNMHYNLKLFGLRGIKMPIKFGVGVKVTHKSLRKGSIVVKKNKKVYFGLFGNPSIISTKKCYVDIGKNAQLIFDGNASLSFGASISIYDNGLLIIGNDFYCNNCCSFFVRKKINIGEKTLFGSFIEVRDFDGGHNIYFNEEIKIDSGKEVAIGKNVWICSHAHIYKGTSIGDNCIIAGDSIVLSSFGNNNLIGGYPAKSLRSDIKGFDVNVNLN